MTGRSLRIGTLLLGSLVMFSSGGSSNAKEPASLAPPSSGVPFATDFGQSDGGGCSNVGLLIGASKCTGLGATNCDACPTSCRSGCSTVTQFSQGGPPEAYGEWLWEQCSLYGSTYNVIACVGPGPINCTCTGAVIALGSAWTWSDQFYNDCDTLK